MITQNRLRDCLEYDEATGIFRWKVTQGRAVEGMVAGSPHEDGYIQIKIDKLLHKAHRLAWMYVYGSFPNSRIDHKDNNGSNNKIENLRLATHCQNMANRKINKNSTTGYKGVSKDKKSGNFIAYINHQGKRTYLGRSFKSPEEAHVAYMKAALEKHGEFARVA